MSRAHVFFSSKQKSIDGSVKSYCTNQENCRRVALLRAISVALKYQRVVRLAVMSVGLVLR